MIELRISLHYITNLLCIILHASKHCLLNALANIFISIKISVNSGIHQINSILHNSTVPGTLRASIHSVSKIIIFH